MAVVLVLHIKQDGKTFKDVYLRVILTILFKDWLGCVPYYAKWYKLPFAKNAS